MKKYIKKIFNIIMLFLIVILLNTPQTYAGPSLDDVIKQGDDFLSVGNTSGTVSDDDILETSDFIYGVLMFIGIAVAFIWGVVLGIRFVTGAMAEKADVKQEIMVYIFGCAILFLAPTIWKLVLGVTQGIQ